MTTLSELSNLTDSLRPWLRHISCSGWQPKGSLERKGRTGAVAILASARRIQREPNAFTRDAKLPSFPLLSRGFDI